MSAVGGVSYRPTGALRCGQTQARAAGVVSTRYGMVVPYMVYLVYFAIIIGITAVTSPG